MKGLNTTSYLTRSLLNEIFEKSLSTEEIDKLILDGVIIKHFSYYKASEGLLRELGVIPSNVKIQHFGALAKKRTFALKDIQDIFDCSKDTAKILVRKYFERRYNYWYKNDVLVEILNDGIEEVIV